MSDVQGRPESETTKLERNWTELLQELRIIQIVNTGNRLAIVTLAVVAVVLAGTVTFIFDVVVGDTAALVVGIVAVVVLGGLWVALPLSVRPRTRPERA